MLYNVFFEIMDRVGMPYLYWTPQPLPDTKIVKTATRTPDETTKSS